MYMCAFIHMCVYMYVNMHIDIYGHVYMYVYVHIYIYVQVLQWGWLSLQNHSRRLRTKGHVTYRFVRARFECCRNWVWM